jgi:hypothetical protein
MILSLKTCELLDKILNAFGNTEHLDKETILEIFNNDENEASNHVNILSKWGLIRKIGEINGSKLGLLFYKEEQADIFMAEGGFVEKYKESEKKHKEENDLKLLEKKNLELQNEALSYQKTIRDQDNRIRDLDERIKKFEMLKNYEWLIRLSVGIGSGIATWWFTLS